MTKTSVSRGLSRWRPAAFFMAVSFVILGVGFVHEHVAQGRFDDVKIEATHVAGTVHMLTGAGGNMGVSLGDDGVFLVDDQYGPLAERISAAIGKLGGGAPSFLLNTHYHGDHTGGNSAFDVTTPIMAHDNVRARLVSGHQPRNGEPKPAPASALPDLTYSDTITLHFNGEKVEVVHYPSGHTDGDSVVFFTGSDVVHMGDNMFAGTFPFVDLSAGGSVQGLTANVEKILKRVGAETRIIPGHGPLSRRPDLEAFLGMLQETTALVKEAMAAGRTVEEIQAAGLPEKWDNWGGGFIKTDVWLKTIYDSLSTAS